MAKTRKNIRCFSRDLTAFLNIFHFIHRNSGFQRKIKLQLSLLPPSTSDVHSIHETERKIARKFSTFRSRWMKNTSNSDNKQDV